MTKDTLFSIPQPTIEPFAFNESVARVFDDMIHRSTPLYDELQGLLASLALELCQPGSTIYDLGCSTGETLRHIASRRPDVGALIGIDSSAAMIERAQQKCSELTQIQFTLGDIETYAYRSSSVFILTYILQFIPVDRRLDLLRKLHTALTDGGAILLSEKVSIPTLQPMFTTLHEAYKRDQHYSDMEIKQKREALENVLVSLSYDENRDLLRQAGFTTIQPFFQYLNFMGIVAIK